MPNYRPEPFDWPKWIKLWREYWIDRDKDTNKPGHGYYSIEDFPSGKLRAIDTVEKDLADGFDPKPAHVAYVEKTERSYPSDGYSPLQRSIARSRGWKN